jgi:hypothetical protein
MAARATAMCVHELDYFACTLYLYLSMHELGQLKILIASASVLYVLIILLSSC